MNKGIVIAGATGEVGKRLASKLIAHNPNRPIIALVRQINTELPEQVIQIKTDYKNLNNVVLDHPIEMAYCCLGTTIKQAKSKDAFYKVDHDYPVQFAHWVQTHDCNRFVCITATGANHNSKNYYLKVKGETEHDLTQRHFSHLWLIRPSLLLGDRNEFRFGEFLGAIIGRLLSPIMVGPFEKYRPIQMMTLASTMAKLADNENPREGCHVLEGRSLHSDAD